MLLNSPPPGDAPAQPTAPEATAGVPLLRPRLPDADRLLPYLRRIDANRIYSNHGPLGAEFEERLEGLIAPDGGAVVAASSGTAAIIGAILATAGRATAERPLALVPAFTFVATAVAAEACGYRIALADIDAEDWMLRPEAAADHPLLSEVGVVVPVATFGRPTPQAPWRHFQEVTGIPVVIDGAASFDRILGAPERYVGGIPVALSFHATKAFGIGEGGCVATADEELAGSVLRALNFGFRGERNSRSASINGKLSEISCGGGSRRTRRLARETGSVPGGDRRLSSAPGEWGQGDPFRWRPGHQPRLCALRVRPRVGSLARAGRSRAAGHRDPGMVRAGPGPPEPVPRHEPSVPGALPVTDDLAPRVLGLPMAPDLTDGQINVVAIALAEALSSRRRIGPPGR